MRCFKLEQYYIVEITDSEHEDFTLIFDSKDGSCEMNTFDYEGFADLLIDMVPIVIGDGLEIENFPDPIPVPKALLSVIKLLGYSP